MKLIINLLKKKHIASSTTVLGTNVLSGISTFTSLTLAAKMLTIDQFGSVIFLLAVITIASQIVDFGMDINIIRSPESEINRSFFNATIVKVTTFVLLIPISFLVKWFIFNQSLTDVELLIIVVGSLLVGINNMLLAKYQSSELYVKYAASKLSVTLFRFAIVLIGFILHSSYMFIVIGYFILPYVSSLIRTIIYCSQFRIGGIKLEAAYMKQQLIFGFWVMLSTLSSNLILNVDTLFVKYYIDLKQVAIYGVATLIISPISLLMSSLSTVLLPQSKNISSNFEDIIYFIKKSLYISIPICIIAYLVLTESIPIVIEYIYGDAFKLAGNISQILIIGYLFSIIATPTYIISYTINKPQLMTISDVARLVVCILLNIIFIPIMGIRGAAIASMLTRIVGGVLTVLLIMTSIKRTKYKLSHEQIIS
ncbi:oligosaccharide flippase family protein [Paenibacillus sacheonensis]|uniref:Oligosaccharide flippase family protein n=1 Tax=Paenibacillus sacheonensis TaxID=742054 RepID=A0A7X4YP21_9BACL|nr:oligosaccharide flippase family protein [Paenibacillus sacheonensis]MBM7567318.1 O-antigen/teichoic acid export membrane protein [Paenibacillus sacheonensis]NBC69898.1 oligosaccharide flippase family protein [Paenibacillus sacheonensis]